MLRHCITLFFVPFYFVRFPDFFLGDQLTSHTQTIYDLIHVIASIITRSFINFNDIYVKLPEKTVLILRYTSLILPQFIRLVQNLRRYRDTKLMYPNIYNGIKYLLSIISCCLIQFPIPFFIAQTVYSLYALYWDIHEDWGLFRNKDIHSPWFLLRKKTLISHPLCYHVCIWINVILRFIWIPKLLLVHKMDEDVIYLVFGSLEVIRRGIWNIFRMENEQVNNCGNFR
ncbi:hypothetical protein WA171_007174 [Blastocystis sp. BT1]